VADKWTWDIDPPVRSVFLSLPGAAQEALVALMQGIIGDDPLGIRQKAAEINPGGATLSLDLGDDGEGLVTVLVIVRATHVQVIQITWAG
jgi:hypothetical protein